MPERPPVLRPAGVSGVRRLQLSDYGAKATGETARASASARGYGPRWQKARLTVLQAEPLCRPSLLIDGRTEAAGVLDHWYPHCGLQWVFWLRELWVPMSKAWHDGQKAEIEARGEPALDEIGMRLGHPMLSSLEPERIWEWRAAFATRERRRVGGR